MKKAKIAFICVHNSCRSQMAEVICKFKYFNEFECFSAGTEKKDKINQDAVRIIKKIYNIDMTKKQRPKLIDEIPKVDIVITMGCNVKCPTLPSCYKEDWGLDDPSHKTDKEFIKTINIIEDKLSLLKKRYMKDELCKK